MEEKTVKVIVEGPGEQESLDNVCHENYEGKISGGGGWGGWGREQLCQTSCPWSKIGCAKTASSGRSSLWWTSHPSCHSPVALLPTEYSSMITILNVRWLYVPVRHIRMYSMATTPSLSYVFGDPKHKQDEPKLDYIMFSTEQNHFIWLLYRITNLRSFSIIFYSWGKPVTGPNPKVGSSASEIVREWVVSPRKIIRWSPNP